MTLTNIYDTPVRPFLEYSSRVVGDSCGWGESRDRQSEVERVLRALGNAGVLPSPHLPQSCFLVSHFNMFFKVLNSKTLKSLGIHDEEDSL